jgi:hypothetical protein
MADAIFEKNPKNPPLDSSSFFSSSTFYTSFYATGFSTVEVFLSSSYKDSDET